MSGFFQFGGWNEFLQRLDFHRRNCYLSSDSCNVRQNKKITKGQKWNNDDLIIANGFCPFICCLS
jgi:hypothetical protein